MFVFEEQPSETVVPRLPEVTGAGMTDKEASKAAKKKGEEIIKQVIERDSKFKLL